MDASHTAEYFCSHILNLRLNTSPCCSPDRTLTPVCSPAHAGQDDIDDDYYVDDDYYDDNDDEDNNDDDDDDFHQ